MFPNGLARGLSILFDWGSGGIVAISAQICRILLFQSVSVCVSVCVSVRVSVCVL